MKAIVLSLCMLLCSVVSVAQTDSTIVLMGNRPAMTVPVDIKISNKQFNMNRLHHSLSLAVPVAAVGFAMMPADHAIRDRVVEGMPGFQCRVDDYIQYAPLATQLTLSMCGVQGRSKNRWQVLVTDALAAAMMAAVVNGMKYSID